MGFVAYGRKVAETDQEVRYEFGASEHDPDAGVLVILTADPESWHVEGRPDRPPTAQRVWAKAVRAWRTAYLAGLGLVPLVNGCGPEWTAISAVFSDRSRTSVGRA